MSFTVQLGDHDFALTTGQLTINDATLVFLPTSNASQLTMQLNLTIVPDQIGPFKFTTEDQFGVFKIGQNMFATGLPEIVQSLDGDQLHLISRFNITTLADKKEHFLAISLANAAIKAEKKALVR